MTGMKILGIGGYVPENVVDNHYFESYLDTSDEWITTRSGIHRRHFAKGEYTWEMGAKAAKMALEQAQIDPATLDVIIGTTVTNDNCTPAMANLIQKELGAEHAFSYDINAACTGFIYALDIASLYLATGRARRVLVVSSERLSQIMNFQNRDTCVLFGDGAGAMVVEADENSPMPVACTHSVIDEKEVLYCRLFPNDDPAGQRETQRSLPMDGIHMNGREVYKFAVGAMAHSVEEVLEKAGITAQDIDLLVPHQANRRIIESAAKRLQVPMDKVMVTLDEYGNTSSASIPLALTRLDREGRLKKGDRVVLTGFGAGLTCGAILVQW
ncbi:MAG: beta-ketoacyl-ACP synthase III [Eubacteriales bacterium]|jgi:3-oxoacyl-[acyl-carrier-protein] synthase-3